MPQLVELPEFPLGQRIVLPRSYLCRVFLILIEILEEVLDQEESDEERGNDEIGGACEDESPTKPFRQRFPVSVFQEQLPDLALRVENVVHDALIDVPFQSPGEELSMAEERNWKGHVKDVLVDHGYEIILLPHQTVGNVMCVHSLLVLRSDRSTTPVGDTGDNVRIGVAQGHESANDFLPGD